MRKYVSENFSEEKLNEELASEKIAILIGEDKHGIVAYVKLVKSPERKTEAGNPVEIARLYTRVHLIGQGIGKSMLEAVEYYAEENGHDAICLDVWQKNFKAINFYQREGFRICGTTQFVLGSDVQDDFVMIRKIAPLKD
jgi:GNAT superfamily N-acetyltransferase